ncbi:Histone acetyltransferase KAT6A [Holothuria leucospilota]|uniref:Histone acetyltransferase KAT6A n=1 Tax=Holothuria leucospilota TaxID=206669 RepID=A0A9Q1HKM0_HOLLE|nr:Histone acetyltransferase KAT6A [Holothuria leucospilota]
MNYSITLAERSRLSPWQCIDCKTCHVCSDSGDAARKFKGHPTYKGKDSAPDQITKDTLLFCDACDKGYHMVCHQPPLFQKPSGMYCMILDIQCIRYVLNDS